MKDHVHDDFHVREGQKVKLKSWPTAVKPVYRSKKHYHALLAEHVEQLSNLLSSTLFTPTATTTPDAVCQATRPAGVTTAAALVVTTTKTPVGLIVPTTSYYRPDGALLGTGADLIAIGQGVFLSLKSGIWQSGDGTYPINNSTAWTGSPAIDQLGSLASTCGNWTDSTQADGIYGVSFATFDSIWTHGTVACSSSSRFYCVQTAP